MDKKIELDEICYRDKFVDEIAFPEYMEFQKEMIHRNIEYFDKLKKEYKQTLCVVIPTKDEENGIENTIKASEPYADSILLIDGHSKDRTREIAETCGVRVVLDNGKGKGSALRQAINTAEEDIIIFIDADGSHNPHDIPRIVAPIVKDEFDHVGGSRSKGGSDELHGDLEKFMRMVGSDIINLSINYRFDVRLTDTQNGFRALRASVARDLNLQENITTIEQEMIIKSLRKGYRVGEVPAFEHARKGGTSKIVLSKVWFRYCYSLIKYLFFG